MEVAIRKPDIDAYVSLKIMRMRRFKDFDDHELLSDKVSNAALSNLSHSFLLP